MNAFQIRITAFSEANFQPYQIITDDRFENHVGVIIEKLKEIQANYQATRIQVDKRIKNQTKEAKAHFKATAAIKPETEVER